MAERTSFPRPGGNWKVWAEEVVSYFKSPLPVSEVVNPRPILLQHQTITEVAKAVTAGLLMYDPVKGLPVMADGSEFREIALMKDNVSSNYIIIGGILVQWGKETASGASATITFPTPFNDINAVVIVAAQTHAYPSTIVAASFLMTGTASEDKYWIALGVAIP